MTSDTDSIQQTLAKGRGQRLELLPKSATVDEIARSLMALANAEGGHLALRVDDVQNAGATETLEENIIMAATNITPLLIIGLPKVVKLKDRVVVVADVPRGLPSVYGYEGHYLQRRDTVNVPLSPLELRRLMLVRGDLSFEMTVPHEAHLDDIDWRKVEDYGRHVRSNQGDVQTLLHQRGCLTRIDGVLRPTYAGLLLFGKRPQQYLQGAEITAVRFAGTVMGDVFNRQDIGGTLIEQIKQVETFLRDYLRKEVHLGDNMAREERYEYPMEAAREIVINAIAHRDYSIRGDTIRLSIFSDRMEVSSPGQLAGHITLTNIKDERFSRNPIIVQVLSDLRYIERLGYGVDRVLELMAKQSLDMPTFEESEGTFKVVFRKGAEHIASDALPASTEQTPKQAKEPVIIGGKYRGIVISERQASALVHLYQDEYRRISNSDLKALFPDVHPETIRRDLVALVNKGILVKMGEKRGSYYVLKEDA